MNSQADIEEKLWKALKSDRTVMVGLANAEEGHSRPMTALFEEERGPLWIFTSVDNSLAEGATSSRVAFMSFASKGHDLFASLTGSLVVDTDRAVIERLWNPYVAAWYEGGKDDPKLVLLRFDADRAEVWLDANSLIEGIKMLLGKDPKKDYADKVTEIEFR
jgi:general stress protein 26